MKKRLTLQQVNDRILDRGYRMVSEFVNVNAKSEFVCGEGHLWLATPDSVMRGNGCPTCANLKRADDKSLSIEEVIRRTTERGIEYVDGYKNCATVARFKCRCGHIWSTTAWNVFAGKGCPLCASTSRGEALRISASEVNARLFERGIRLVGEFELVKIKTDFRCDCGNIWSAKPNNVLNGTGCPKCAKTGFKTTLPGVFYIIRAVRGSSVFIGYGITNSVKTRLRRHRKNLRNAGYAVDQVVEIRAEGHVVELLERAVKRIFPQFGQEIDGFIVEATFDSEFDRLVKFADSFVALCNP